MDYRILFIAPAAAFVLSASTASAQLPTGWQPYTNFMAPKAEPAKGMNSGHEIGIDPATESSRSRVLTVRSTAPQIGEISPVGAAWQVASGYAGQRVRFSAQVRADGVRQWAGLYLGAGAAGLLDQVAFGRPNAEQHVPAGAGVAVGTTGWQDLSVVIDVPADALSINLGVALVGDGQVWARGLRFETVGGDVPVTSTPIGIDWRHAREVNAEGVRRMSQVPPQALANATLD